MSKFDEWLTTEPDYLFSPLFHEKELVIAAEDEWSNSQNPHGDDKYESPNSVYLLAFDNCDGLTCQVCSESVGWVLDDNDEYKPRLNFTEFYQVDEDGEHLLCVPCFEEVTNFED